jgi:hypothetical protein
MGNVGRACAGVEEAASIGGQDCASMDEGMSGTSNGYMAKDVPGEEANASVGRCSDQKVE